MTETNIIRYVSCTSISKKLITATRKQPEFRLLFSGPVHRCRIMPKSTCLMTSALNPSPFPSLIYVCAISSFSEALLWFCFIDSDSLSFCFSTNCLSLHLNYWTAPRGIPSWQELSIGMLMKEANLCLMSCLLYPQAPATRTAAKTITNLPWGNWHLVVGSGAEISLPYLCHMSLLLFTLIPNLLLVGEVGTQNMLLLWFGNNWDYCALKKENQVLSFFLTFSFLMQ